MAWKERVDTIEQAGPDRWVRIVSRRFSSGLGFVVMQDVSEQKKKENLLRIEQELLSSARREIESTKVGELVMRELKLLDKVAYVRFASVYRSFEDVDEFRQLLRDI